VTEPALDDSAYPADNIYNLRLADDLIPAAGTAGKMVPARQGASGAARIIPIEFKTTQLTRQNVQPMPLRIVFNTPPVRIANGKMKAIIARAMPSPLSLTIIKKLAMHGTKRVIVTRLTTI